MPRYIQTPVNIVYSHHRDCRKDLSIVQDGIRVTFTHQPEAEAIPVPLASVSTDPHSSSETLVPTTETMLNGSVDETGLPYTTLTKAENTVGRVDEHMPFL
jgi:hypothetical protein